MKYILVVLAFVAGQALSQTKQPANEGKKVWIQSSVRDSSLSLNETSYSLIIQNSGITNSTSLLYQLDKNGENLYGTLSGQKVFFLITTPGKHKIVIAAGSAFKELKIKLNGKPGHHVTIIINFKRKRQKRRRKKPINTVRKPVIYLYPQEELSVDVKLEVKGELVFTYPSYEDGWSVQAQPDGTITHNDSQYNYLFWESNQEITEDHFDITTGFIVSGGNVTSFLEASLSKFGFTSKESADFITYWAPEMKDNSNLYLCFVYNDACDAFAELTISPEPDVLARFYMLWSPVANTFDSSSIKEQDIPTIDRNGFVVLEWGGMEINLNTLKEIN